MKITENKIKQIILEELSDILEQDDQNKEQETKPAPGQNPEEKEKDMSDVALVMKQMPRIDNFREYEQMLGNLLAHDFGDPQRKMVILKKARNQINKMLTGK